MTSRGTKHTLGIRWAFVAFAQHLLDGRYAYAVIRYYGRILDAPHSSGFRLILQEFAGETDLAENWAYLDFAQIQYAKHKLALLAIVWEDLHTDKRINMSQTYLHIWVV